MIETQGPGDRALVNALLFEGLGQREIILGIEERIAEGEVQSSMKLRSAWLGDDLDPSLARAVGLGAVRIVVDVRLRNRRRGNARAIHLDAVHDDADPAGGDARLIQKRRKRCNVIL